MNSQTKGFKMRIRQVVKLARDQIERIFLKKLYLKRFYKNITGKSLNLKNPRAYTEKIQWRKLYDRDPLIIETTDKLKVREYVERKIGKHVLTRIYWVGKDPADVPFDSLPNSFVLRTNHGCGFNIFVRDKSKLAERYAIGQL